MHNQTPYDQKVTRSDGTEVEITPPEDKTPYIGSVSRDAMTLALMESYHLKVQIEIANALWAIHAEMKRTYDWNTKEI